MRKILLMVLMLMFSIGTIHVSAEMVDELEDFTLTLSHSNAVRVRTDHAASLKGDTNVVDCSSSGKNGEYISYAVDENEEITVITYRQYSASDEFIFSHISDGTEEDLVSTSFDVVCPDNKEYYSTIYRVRNTLGKGEFKIKYPVINSSNHWKYLIGKVVIRNSLSDKIEDDFSDFSKLYDASYHINHAGAGLERKTIATNASSAVYHHYPYVPEQYITYKYNNVSKKKDICINISKSVTVDEGKADFLIETSSDMQSWTEVDTKSISEGNSETMRHYKLYFTDTVGGERYLRICWSDKATVMWAPVIRSVSISDFEYSAEIKNLKYYTDGRLIGNEEYTVGKNIEVTGIVENTTQRAWIIPVIYLAVYNEDNSLYAVSCKNIGYTGEGECKSFNILANADGNSKVKLFCFLDEKQFPLCDMTKEIQIYQKSDTVNTFTDELDTIENLYSYAQNMKISINTEETAQRTGGDTSVLSRTYINLGAQSFKYFIPDMKSAVIEAYSFRMNKKSDVPIRVYASRYDGDYEELDVSVTCPTHTADDWYKRIYTISSMPENTDFLKIVIADDNEWSTMVGSVVITH